MKAIEVYESKKLTITNSYGDPETGLRGKKKTWVMESGHLHDLRLDPLAISFVVTESVVALIDSEGREYIPKEIQEITSPTIHCGDEISFDQARSLFPYGTWQYDKMVKALEIGVHRFSLTNENFLMPIEEGDLTIQEYMAAYYDQPGMNKK